MSLDAPAGPSDAFFFQEGHGPVCQRACYGRCLVDDKGPAVLVGLRDEDLRPLRPETE